MRASSVACVRLVFPPSRNENSNRRRNQRRAAHLQRSARSLPRATALATLEGQREHRGAHHVQRRTRARVGNDGAGKRASRHGARREPTRPADRTVQVSDGNGHVAECANCFFAREAVPRVRDTPQPRNICTRRRAHLSASMMTSFSMMRLAVFVSLTRAATTRWERTSAAHMRRPTHGNAPSGSSASTSDCASDCLWRSHHSCTLPCGEAARMRAPGSRARATRRYLQRIQRCRVRAQRLHERDRLDPPRLHLRPPWRNSQPHANAARAWHARAPRARTVGSGASTGSGSPCSRAWRQTTGIAPTSSAS